VAKVKPPFFVRIAVHKCRKGQCNSCKEWNTIAEEIIQKKKVAWKSESASKSKAPKPLKSMK
jgi:DNA repair protein RadA/Sms